MSELVWVSVPAGAVTDGKAIVQVVVVPQLDEAGLLELGNWADRVLEPTFQPEVLVNGQAVSAELVRTARPDVWQAFFPPGTTVLPWQAPAARAADAIVVRPSSAEEQDLTTAYADAATDIDNPAHVTGVISGFRGDRRIPSPRRTQPVAEDRAQADFHEIVAGLRDQPAVLRSLGLILDLRIDTPAPGRGEVRVTWPGGNLLARSPLTAYMVEAGHFLPAALDPSESWPRIAGGMVDVRPVAGWRLSTIDIDQGVASLGAAQASGRTDTMPAPRTSGISLLRKERSADLLAEAGRSQARGADLDDEVLGIADLVLGYRVDARTRGRSWFPLGARRATHTVNGIDVVREALEDAHIKPFAVTREDDQLSTDEVVTRWTGWGLGTLRPHERATVVEMPSQAARRQPTRQPQAFDHRWEFTEPGDQSQLPLRFGQTYEMRVRVADLAGGGLSLDDPVDSLGTDPVVFLRHEPVPPPNLVTPDALLVPRPEQPRRADGDPGPLGPGGALDTLVVRSDRAVSPAAFAAAHPPYPDNAHRRLRPPDTTLTLAEHHGRLDGPMEEAEPVFRRGLGLDGAPPLPDPMSHGVVFHLAGTAEGSSVVWPGDWPDLGEVPMTLEPLQPGDVMAAATDHDGTVLVRLPQGEAVDLDVRSMLQRTDQAYFQLSRWLDTRRDPGLVNSPDLAMHSLAAPPSTLRLVHAIRRPLRDPSGNMRVTRVKD
ncbi:MAG: hypothetical protein GEV10_18350 [Streptosporangiales bacterium]|nr:hypothetical protein [Streptosporangiales bacterium]